MSHSFLHEICDGVSSFPVRSSTHAHRESESCEGRGIPSNHSDGERLIKPRDEPVAESTEDVMTDPARPQVSRPLGVTSRWKPVVPSTGLALSAACKPKRVYRKRMRGAWKAKAKRWSNVKYARAAASRVNRPVDVSMQPDLEDVDGVLFVSFTAKVCLCSCRDDSEVLRSDERL